MEMNANNAANDMNAMTNDMNAMGNNMDAGLALNMYAGLDYDM